MKSRLSISLVLTLLLATVNWGNRKNTFAANLSTTAANSQCTSNNPCPMLLAGEIRCNDDDDCGKKPRSPNANEVLKIISPRNTLLLNDKPILSWSPVPGANSYTVRVVESTEVKWENPKPVQGTQITYPSDAPALQPAASYEVIVEVNNGNNGESGKATFRMLSKENAKQVEDFKEQIVKRNLPKDEEALELARFYRQKKLFAEAIEILAAVKDTSQKAIIYQILGNLYLDVELPTLAKREYKQALQLATKTNNLEEKAEAQYGLGAAYEKINSPNEAIPLLEAAWNSYKTLNDIKQKTDVAHYLGKVYKDMEKRKEAIRWFEEALIGYKTLNNQRGVERMQKKLEQLKQ